MFRKLLLAAAASLSLLSPLALPVVSQAHEQHHRHQFRVYVRNCASEPWAFAGSYHHRSEALRVAHRYQERGMESYVR